MISWSLSATLCPPAPETTKIFVKDERRAASGKFFSLAGRVREGDHNDVISYCLAGSDRGRMADLTI
jgi:hypothetical protein